MGFCTKFYELDIFREVHTLKVSKPSMYILSLVGGSLFCLGRLTDKHKTLLVYVEGIQVQW